MLIMTMAIITISLVAIALVSVITQTVTARYSGKHTRHNHRESRMWYVASKITVEEQLQLTGYHMVHMYIAKPIFKFYTFHTESVNCIYSCKVKVPPKP